MHLAGTLEKLGYHSQGMKAADIAAPITIRNHSIIKTIFIII